MAPERTGVLLTAFGGPDSIESVGPFMSGFMGREPSPAAVVAAQDKYRAIGGCSPLPATADAVARSLERRLQQRGHDVVVRAGMRYWEPTIRSAMAELTQGGASRVAMASLSALDSQVTCESYRTAALDAARELAVSDVVEAPMLHCAPQYREFFGEACMGAIAGITASRPLVLMTAHSLPVADLRSDEPYVWGLREVSDAVAAIAGLGTGSDFEDDHRLPGITAFGSLDGPVPWLLAYQSRGVRPGEWLGPDLKRVMDGAAPAGYDGIVVVPIGFAIDHMETLWDLDIDAAELARERRLAFVRTPVPNDSASFIEALVWATEPLL